MDMRYSSFDQTRPSGIEISYTSPSGRGVTHSQLSVDENQCYKPRSTHKTLSI